MTYKLKYSDVSAKSPVSTDLVLGEIAVNTTDGDLYAKNDSGVIQLLKRRPIEIPTWKELHQQGSGIEGGDPYYNFVELLLHMDGNEGAQTWIDSSKNNYTVTGQNVFNSTTTKKFGTASAKTGPGNAYLLLPGPPFNFNTRPFTIDFWIFAPAAASDLWPYWISTAMYNSGDGFYGTIDGPGTGWGGNGVISFTAASPVTNGGSVASTTVIRGAWHHIAVCRDGPKTTLFVDGHLESTHIAAGVANYGITYGNQLLFRDMDGRWPEPNTAIDDFRVTVGVVRYTKDFSVPTGPSSNFYGDLVTTYTNNQINNSKVGDDLYNDVLLLYTGRNGLTDESLLAGAFSQYGNAALSSNQPLFGQNTIKFDGVYNSGAPAGEHLTIPKPASFNFTTSRKITFETWIYLTGVPTNFAAIISMDNNITNNWFNFAVLIDNQRRIRLSISADGINQTVNFPSTSSIPLNQWAFVEVSIDNNTIRIFIDGVLSGTTTYSGTIHFAGTDPIQIGTWFAQHGIAASREYLNAYLGPFRVTMGVRNTTNYSVPAKTFDAFLSSDPYFNNRVLGLHFNEPPNNVTVGYALTDNSPRPKSAVAFNSSSIGTTPGAFNTGLRLNGTNDLVTIQHHTDFTLTGDFTFSCYLKFTAMGSVVYIYDDETLTEYGILFSKNASNIIGFTFMRSDKTVTYGPDLAGLFSTTVIQTNVLYHVAVTRSGDTLRIFIAGNLEGSMIIPIGVSIHSPGGVKYIGARQGNGNFQTNYMTGIVDEFYLYNGIALWTSNFTPPKPFPSMKETTELKGWDKFKTALDKQIANFKTIGLPYGALVIGNGTLPGSGATFGSILLPDNRVFIPPSETTTAYIYDPYSNKLTTSAANFPSPTTRVCILLPGGRVLLVSLNAAQGILYDPTTDSFTLTSGTFPAGLYGGVLMADGRVYLIPFSGLTAARIYDPITDTISTPNGVYPNQNSDFANGVLLTDGRVFVCPRSFTSARIYDPVSDTLSTPIGSYPANSSGVDGFSNGVLLPDGRVYIMTQGSTDQRSKIYDPVTNTLANAGGFFPNNFSNGWQNGFNGAVLMPDGRVFCVPGLSTTARIYDPVTDTLITPPGTYPGGQSYFFGTMMHNGNIFLAPYNSTQIAIILSGNGLPIHPMITHSPFFNKA